MNLSHLHGCVCTYVLSKSKILLLMTSLWPLDSRWKAVEKTSLVSEWSNNVVQKSLQNFASRSETMTMLHKKMSGLGSCQSIFAWKKIGMFTKALNDSPNHVILWCNQWKTHTKIHGYFFPRCIRDRKRLKKPKLFTLVAFDLLTHRKFRNKFCDIMLHARPIKVTRNCLNSGRYASMFSIRRFSNSSMMALLKGWVMHNLRL